MLLRYTVRIVELRKKWRRKEAKEKERETNDEVK
jgi:hypothetical protein